MPFPFAIGFGSHTILLHTLLESAAYFIGFRYFLFLRKRQGDTITANNRIWIIIATIFGSLLGSRLLGGLENPVTLQSAVNKGLYFYQNKTILGGLLGGLIIVELVKKLIKEKHSSGDLITYPLMLALIVGRIGCFSMGVFEDTFGIKTSLPWGMELGDGVPRHPVCLYEILFLVLAWIALVQLQKRYILAEGARFKLFMISYLTFRFLLDFIKPHYTYAIGLSTIQVAAVLGLLYYADDIIHPDKLVQKAKREKTFRLQQAELGVKKGKLAKQ
jgi:phosphatidylglycerol:prolipoprotein diacylglycerol transferase